MNEVYNSDMDIQFNMPRNHNRLLPLVLVLVVLLAGCGPRITEDKPYLEVRDGWARTMANLAGRDLSQPDAWKTPVGPLGLGPNGLVFMTIENKGGTGDRLLKASATNCDAVELHQMVVTGEETYSYLVTAIDLPAHAVTEFKSGAYYIRLVGLKQQLNDGAKFDLTLEFEQSGKRTVEIVVSNP